MGNPAVETFLGGEPMTGTTEPSIRFTAFASTESSHRDQTHVAVDDLLDAILRYGGALTFDDLGKILHALGVRARFEEMR